MCRKTTKDAKLKVMCPRLVYSVENGERRLATTAGIFHTLSLIQIDRSKVENLQIFPLTKPYWIMFYHAKEEKKKNACVYNNNY